MHPAFSPVLMVGLSWTITPFNFFQADVIKFLFLVLIFPNPFFSNSVFSNSDIHSS